MPLWFVRCVRIKNEWKTTKFHIKFIKINSPIFGYDKRNYIKFAKQQQRYRLFIPKVVNDERI